MKLDTIIFDLDGTLLNTLDDLTAAVNHALNTFGMGGISVDTVRRFVGNGVPLLMERALYFVTTGQELAEGRFEDRALFNSCLAVFTEYYDAHSMDYTSPYGGVTDMLCELKRMGIKTAIVTNKYDGAAQALKNKFFKGVDVIVGARDGLAPKPSPDGVYKALELLHAEKQCAVYVGDGETDMKTAQNCGIPAVAVTWGFRDREVLSAFNPAFIIDKPSELIPVLRDAALMD